jgi:hypothetical protein
MAKSNGFKAASIASFIILVSFFVVYRGGYLDGFLQRNVSKKQSQAIQLNQDSIKSAQTILPSSKVLILTDNVNFDIDSVKNAKDTVILTKEELKLMAGSKSAVIFKPKAIITDSVKQKK